MPRRPLPSELSRFAFTTAEGREHGVGRARLRGRDVANPHHGIHVATASMIDDGPHSRCERLLPAFSPDHWYSHRTAARLWNMPLRPPYVPAEGLHVLTVGRRVPLRHAGVVGWTTSDDAIDRQLLGQLPVIAPAEVWCQLAARGAVVGGELIEHEWLVAAGDFLLTGRRGYTGAREAALCTLDDLRAAVERRGGGRGTAMLRRALDDLRFPVDSPYETRLRLGLVACGLPEPRVQLPVLTAKGMLHADLGYPEQRVAIEYQGDEHRTSRARWLSDLTRVQLLQDAGYHVILVGADDLQPDCRALAERVRRALGRENAH